jgi:GNAT superfamily N-acetyltransferase
MNDTAKTVGRRCRSLVPADLDRVIAIDRAYTGHERRRFFEKRFAAAKAHPDEFVLLGVVGGASLAGFAFAHLLRGEFGREQVGATLDVIGVAPESHERGLGQLLIDELIEVLRRHGVKSLHSQADWTNDGLLRFFDTSGFQLAPRLVLERSVAELLAETTDEV